MSNNMTEVLDNVASALHSLGLNHAGTRMGAIEVLAKEVHDTGHAIASGLHDIADAIREGHG